MQFGTIPACPMPVTILLTRPEDGARRFAGQLDALFGAAIRVVTSPVLKIQLVPDAPNLSGYRGLIFTSAQSVTFGEKGLDCFVVGQSTARAARAFGMQVLASEPDAESLIRRILADGVQGPLLHLRGAHARGDIAKVLCQKGCPTKEAIVYHQLEQPLSPQAKAALSGDAPVIVPLFSPRSAQLFLNQTEGTAPIWAVAISLAAAEQLNDPRIARLIIAETPDADGILKAMEGLIDAATRLEGYSSGN